MSPYFLRQRENVVSVMPGARQMAATVCSPRSACCKIPMICSWLIWPCFMPCLPMRARSAEHEHIEWPTSWGARQLHLKIANPSMRQVNDVLAIEIVACTTGLLGRQYG